MSQGGFPARTRGLYDFLPTAPRKADPLLMIQPRPVYLLAPLGADLRLGALVPGQETIALSQAEELRDRTPGLLLLPIEVLPTDQVLAALAIAAAAPPESPWMPVLLERSDDGGRPLARPVSLGWPTAPAELARWAAGAVDAEVLELRHVLAGVARGRHDLNNPLTSALAETQLALLGAIDPGLRAGLERVEEQLRRIRDLVAGDACGPPSGRAALIAATFANCKTGTLHPAREHH